MRHLRLFTDGSVNTHAKIGFGAYLLVTDLGETLESLKSKVVVKRFEKTSSTKLELQALLWALNEVILLVGGEEIAVTVYTDSQNIIGLPARRMSLESADYYSRKNKRLCNYELYKEFYRLTDTHNCTLIKMKGHQASSNKSDFDKLFSLVDQGARRALREGA